MDNYGRYEVYIRDSHGKVNKKHTFLLVIKKHCKKYKDPIRLLCSINLKNFSNRALVKKYLERWGVENSFKEIKSTLNLEKIQIMKKTRFENMIALIQFSSILSRIIFQNTQKESLSPDLEVKINYMQYIKKESLTANLHSFASFLKVALPRKYKSPALGGKKPKDGLQITLWEFCEEKLGVI